MILISNTDEEELLEQIPDFTDWDKANNWIKKCKRLLKSCSKHVLLNGEIFFLACKDVKQKSEFSFGLYSSKTWRKFVLATFCADILSYPKRIDQVNFERLLFVMHAYPQGFRVWWIKLPNGVCCPVGYTGYYPMIESAFELFKKHPEKLRDRMVVPDSHLEGRRPYLYLFNFSVFSELKKSHLTKVLMKNLVEDIQLQNPKGLACIAVSNDGARVADRFEMTYRGDLVIEDSAEGIYVKRYRL